jgi:hypothetical protein
MASMAGTAVGAGEQARMAASAIRHALRAGILRAPRTPSRRERLRRCGAIVLVAALLILPMLAQAAQLCPLTALPSHAVATHHGGSRHVPPPLPAADPVCTLFAGCAVTLPLPAASPSNREPPAAAALSYRPAAEPKARAVAIRPPIPPPRSPFVS